MIKYYMTDLQKTQAKVQIFVTPEFTPLGTIIRVCNDYVILDQDDNLRINTEIMIPVQQIKSVRIIK